MPSLLQMNWDDRIFAVLVATAAALLVMAVGLTLLALFLRWRNDRVAGIWAALEARWEPILLDVLVEERPPEELQAAVGPGDSLRFLAFLLRFVRRLTGSEVDVVRDLARPHLDWLAREWDRGSAERRARAVQTLGMLGFDGNELVFLAALDDPSPLVSIVAAQALAEPDHPHHVVEVLQRLDRYQDWHPAFLSGMLADAGSGVTPLLRDYLADEEHDAWSRAVAAKALEQLRDPEAADVAAAVLGTNADPDLLVACLRIVGAVGERRHRAVLLPLLDFPHFPVRSHALKALRAVGDDADESVFLRALDDPSPWVALEAARGLRALGAGEILEDLALGGDERALTVRQVIAE
ncbi:MAG: HEAT repeat domain-containing protein [Gemmatimonadetes bacterium]|nr:HEAT repeat domain-containing protein [Gemmatimonadota bacterium]